MNRAAYPAFFLGLVLTLGASAAGGSATGQPKKATPKPIWLVVTRPMFLKPLQPLIEHRKAEGFDVVVSTESVLQAIRQSPRQPAFLLLVGDDNDQDMIVVSPMDLPAFRRSPMRLESMLQKYEKNRGRKNPPWRIQALGIKRPCWGVPEQRGFFLSDATFADLNADGTPDFPVGRLSVRTPEQLQAVVKKILAYETRPPRLEDLDVLIWAGSAEFGPILNRGATPLLLATLQNHAPNWMQPFILSGYYGNVLCGWPPDQPDIFSRRLRERQPGLICMVGHGYPRQFFSMTLGGQLIDYSSQRVRAELGNGPPAGPAIILACLCGMFNLGDEPGLAEEILLSPGGPVACIAASAESHPLPNFYTGQALLKTAEGPQRLGEFWLSALRKAQTLRNPRMESLLRNIEGSMGRQANIEGYLAEHGILYQIFGDPATRLRLPNRLHGSIRKDGDGVWRWRVRKPQDADRLIVTFRPDGQAMPSAPENPRDIEAVRRAFRQANDTFAFERLSELPADRPWEGAVNQPGVLRLVAVGPKRLYVAALRLFRTKP
jgi:hypothetical protein